MVQTEEGRLDRHLAAEFKPVSVLRERPNDI